MASRAGMVSVPECVSDNGVYYQPSCVYPDGPAPAAPAAGPSYADVRAEVYSLLVRLGVPEPSIRLGPEPSANEWNMAVVGLPVWAWADEGTSRSASVTEFGYTFTLNAHRDAVVFDFGEGTAAISCSATAVYPGGSAAGLASPTCGHTYQRPSLPAGSFTVTARARWTVAWSALGYSGTIPLQLSSRRSVRVGELQSVRVG